MYNLLLTILLVLSVVIVIAIFMQPTKNQSSNVFDASSGDLFERSKARGFEAVMQRLTGILVFFFLWDNTLRLQSYLDVFWSSYWLDNSCCHKRSILDLFLHALDFLYLILFQSKMI